MLLYIREVEYMDSLENKKLALLRIYQILYKYSDCDHPLKQEDPDVTLEADERQIGGLGIYLVKQLMDEVSYEYRGGMNILRMRKKLTEQKEA